MTQKPSRSAQRNTFQREKYAERWVEQGKTQDNDPEVQQMLSLFERWDRERDLREQDPEWERDNLEYVLRTTDWILSKTRERDDYAQNLYAALCNNDFQRNDVMPILKDQTWSCSWRHAGGIIADMRESGDYIDWYCSGIRGNPADDPDDGVTRNYVGEGVVTDEIRADLMKLGWLVVQDNS